VPTEKKADLRRAEARNLVRNRCLRRGGPGLAEQTKVFVKHIWYTKAGHKMLTGWPAQVCTPSRSLASRTPDISGSEPGTHECGNSESAAAPLSSAGKASVGLSGRYSLCL
jgi:hypothetical protein